MSDNEKLLEDDFDIASQHLMSRWLTHGYESLPIPGPRPLTFILPHMWERSSLLWFPSPLVGERSCFFGPLAPICGRGVLFYGSPLPSGEGRGEGTLEAMT